MYCIPGTVCTVCTVYQVLYVLYTRYCMYCIPGTVCTVYQVSRQCEEHHEGTDELCNHHQEYDLSQGHRLDSLYTGTLSPLLCDQIIYSRGVTFSLYYLFLQDKRMKCWSEVCSQLFSRPVNLWLDELSPLFSSRVKVVLRLRYSLMLFIVYIL